MDVMLGEDFSGFERSPVIQSTWATADQRSNEARTVRDLLLARANRANHFNSRLFSDPAWDILLELYYSELKQKRVSVSKLGIGARLPLTTVLRWLDALRKEGLIVRRPDPLDGRRVFVALSQAGSQAMQLYFETVPRVAMLA